MEPEKQNEGEGVIVDGKELIALSVQAIRNAKSGGTEGYPEDYQKADLDYFANIQKQIDHATDMAAEVEGEARAERITLIASQVVKWYHQIVFLVWRRGVMTEEIEAKFRALPDVEMANKWINAIALSHKAVEDKINAEMTDLRKENDGLEIFKAVLNGMPRKEAEKRLSEYKAQVEQTLTSNKG